MEVEQHKYDRKYVDIQIVMVSLCAGEQRAQHQVGAHAGCNLEVAPARGVPSATSRLHLGAVALHKKAGRCMTLFFTSKKMQLYSFSILFCRARLDWALVDFEPEARPTSVQMPIVCIYVRLKSVIC